MRLFVRCPDGHKVYLAISASMRSELPEAGAMKCPHDSSLFSIRARDVEAEPETAKAVAGAVVGALIGLLGGPIGLIAGAVAGGAMGGSSQFDENDKVRRFNDS